MSTFMVQINLIKMSYDKETLEDLILVQKISYLEIGRRYGCSSSNIRKVAKKLGILLVQRREINEKETFGKGNRKIENYCQNCGGLLYSSKSKFCCIKCQLDFQYSTFINDWKNDLITGISGQYGISAHIKNYLFNKNNNSCESCGWSEINPISKKIPLQMHHIDGNCLNNKEENLQLLCPNCHALTSTFGNLNKDSKRIFRKQKENNVSIVQLARISDLHSEDLRVQASLDTQR